MSTLAPKMSDQISYERPVGAAPSVLESVLGVATQLGSDFANSQKTKTGNLSASDQKGQALSGYVAELDRISSLDLPQSEKERLVERARRDQLIATPQYRTDISAISGDEFGFDEGEGDVDRVVNDQFNEWLQSDIGLAAASSTKTSLSSQGQVDSASLRDELFVKFQEDVAQKARIAQFANSEADDKIKWRELSPQWSTLSSDMATGLTLRAQENPELLNKPEEVLNILNDTIRTTEQRFRSEALAAGIAPSFVEEQLKGVLAPLNNLKSIYQEDLETPGKVLEATAKAAELGVTRELIETFGPHASDPAFREYFYSNWASTQINGENAGSFFKAMQDAAESGDLDTFNLGVSTVPGVDVAATSNEPVVSPERVTEWKRKMKDDPDFLTHKVIGASNVIQSANMETSEGQQAAMTGLQHIALASQAHEGPLSVETLRVMFSPQNMKRIGQLGEEGKALMSRVLTQQVRYNRSLVSGSSELLSDTRVRQEGGRFIAERRWRDPLGIASAMDVRSDWRPMDPNSEIARTVEAVNYMVTISKQIPGLDKVVSNTTNWLYRGVDPTPEQVSEDISWEDIENVQHVSHQGSPNPLVGLIDKTEGGGAYDTLFGFSNREGGRFSGVKVDEMTIGEVLQFADVNGAYGQWVKEELGRTGHKARVATPMGRYQFVGTTLREVAQDMGLSSDTVFDARTQDAMFEHLARNVIRGKSGEAARKAMRSTWEGFKHVSDTDLDNAIAAFKGLPPSDYGMLTTANGSRSAGPAVAGSGSTSGGTPANGFMAALAEAEGFSPRGRSFNPNVPTGGGGRINTDDATGGSRMTVREARERIAATLRAAGMEDLIKDVLKGES